MGGTGTSQITIFNCQIYWILTFTFSEHNTAVNMLICTACCLEDLADLIHSLKCSNICSLCLYATRGNTCPYRPTELSITATPSGSGPGTGSPYTEKRYLTSTDILIVIGAWLPQILSNELTLRAPAVHSGPELLLPQATSVTILQNACATLVD